MPSRYKFSAAKPVSNIPAAIFICGAEDVAVIPKANKASLNSEIIFVGSSTSAPQLFHSLTDFLLNFLSVQF